MPSASNASDRRRSGAASTARARPRGRGLVRLRLPLVLHRQAKPRRRPADARAEAPEALGPDHLASASAASRDADRGPALPGVLPPAAGQRGCGRDAPGAGPRGRSAAPGSRSPSTASRCFPSTLAAHRLALQAQREVPRRRRPCGRSDRCPVPRVLPARPGHRPARRAAGGRRALRHHRRPRCIGRCRRARRSPHGRAASSASAARSRWWAHSRRRRCCEAMEQALGARV